ncbi:hypothetical protein STEG23_035519 [Scotinomys teguina]
MSDSGEQNYGERESRSASRSGSAHGSGKSARHTPARSRSKEDSRRSRSKSRSRSESRSRSRRSSRRHYTRSRSRSRSHRRSRSRSYSRDYRRRHSHSHSPMSTRRRHVGNRANPDPNCCLGVFGLSLYTTERDLREVFSKYGPIADVSIVYDQQSRRSRGFAFVYFENVDDAKEAKERANGMELDGRRIRVDFSITKRPHTPTPGIYMGRPTYGSSRRRDYYDRGYDRGYDDRDYYSRSYRAEHSSIFLCMLTSCSLCINTIYYQKKLLWMGSETLCGYKDSLEPIPWNWSYRQLPAAVWVLGIEPASSGRAASALNC